MFRSAHKPLKKCLRDYTVKLIQDAPQMVPQHSGPCRHQMYCPKTANDNKSAEIAHGQEPHMSDVHPPALAMKVNGKLLASFYIILLDHWPATRRNV